MSSHWPGLVLSLLSGCGLIFLQNQDAELSHRKERGGTHPPPAPTQGDGRARPRPGQDHCEKASMGHDRLDPYQKAQPSLLGGHPWGRPRPAASY